MSKLQFDPGMTIYYLRKMAWIITVFLIIPVASGQQTVLYQTAQQDFERMQKEFDEGLYGRVVRSAEEYLLAYHEPEFDQFRNEARLIKLKALLRTGHPGTLPLIMAFVSSMEPDPIAQRALLMAGEDAYENGNYTEAIRLLSLVDARSISPADRSVLYFKLGYSLFVLEEFSQAAALFQQAQDARDKYYYPSQYYYGMAHYFLDDYDEALLSFERVAPSEYYRDYIPYYITQIYFNQRSFDRVIDYGTHSLQSPTVQNKTEISHLIGQAYFETEDYENALPHLKVVEQNNEKLRVDDFYQLGIAYYQTGRYAEAIPVFLQIRNESGVKAHYANYYLGQSYLKTGDRVSARNSLRNAMQLHDVPSITTEATFHYGKLSAEAGDDMEAIRVLQTIPPVSPDYNEAQRSLADILINTSDYALAIRELEAMNSLTPVLQEAYQKVTLYRAEQYIQELRYELATPLLDKSLQYPVNKSIHARALFWKGEIAHLDGSFKESIQWFNQYFPIAEKANDLPVNQTAGVGHYNQGYNYLGLSDYTKSQEHFEKSVNLLEPLTAGENKFIQHQLWPDVLLRAGDSAFKRGQYEKAIHHYDQSIRQKLSGFDYAMYQKGIIRGLQKRAADKISLLTELSSTLPQSLWADDALYQLGITYQEESQKQKAVTAYEKIVSDYQKSSPLLHPALLKLGLLSYNSGQYETASKYYKSVFQYNPDPVTAREAMSALQEIYVNELDKPELFFEFAGSIPGYTVSGSERDSILYAAAENHYGQGAYDKAAESFTRYLDQNPAGVYALKAKYLKAESLSLLKKWEEALTAYESVLKDGHSPYLASSFYKAALISYNQKEDMARAYRYYTEYIPISENTEKQFEAMQGALRSAYRLKNSDDVFQWTEQINQHARATDDIRALASYYSAMLAMEAGDFDRALTSFNAVIRLNSAELAAESRYRIASIYERKGELEFAAKLAEESARTNVGYPVWVARALILLSDIHYRQNDLLNARAIIEAILENFHEDDQIVAEAQQRLATIQKAEQDQSRIQPSGNPESQENPKKD